MPRRLRARAERLARDATPGRRQRIQTAADQIGSLAAEGPLRVLDAGSEESLLCLQLARRHPDWTFVAVDRSLPPLQRGQAWAKADGLHVSFVQADLTAPVSNQGFDVVVSLECLMEVSDDRAGLRCMVGALRPGGHLLAQVPTHDWTPVLHTSDRTWRREIRHGYDRPELLEWFEAAGLRVDSIQGVFHRATALAQDWRDAVKGRSIWVRAGLAPVQLAAVRLERRGVKIGRPRAWFVVAVKADHDGVAAP
jgi:SAM-dependent methyltransferase